MNPHPHITEGISLPSVKCWVVTLVILTMIVPSKFTSYSPQGFGVELQLVILLVMPQRGLGYTNHHHEKGGTVRNIHEVLRN